ncbi:hypothetical protein WPG_0963 [Winogradskyella sp. PG-2]|nr:hypothetical protein WPG_0963 [Winogradskyella sp. PG-2]
MIFVRNEVFPKKKKELFYVFSHLPKILFIILAFKKLLKENEQGFSRCKLFSL